MSDRLRARPRWATRQLVGAGLPDAHIPNQVLGHRHVQLGMGDLHAPARRRVIDRAAPGTHLPRRPSTPRTAIAQPLKHRRKHRRLHASRQAPHRMLRRCLDRAGWDAPHLTCPETHQARAARPGRQEHPRGPEISLAGGPQDADVEAHDHECPGSGGAADAGEPEHPGSYIARTRRVDHESGYRSPVARQPRLVHVRRHIPNTNQGPDSLA